MAESFSFSIGTKTPEYTTHCRVRLKDEHGNFVTEGNYYGYSKEELTREIADDAEKVKNNRGLNYVEVDVYCSDPRKW